MFRINCSPKPGLGLFLISLNEGKEKENRIISMLQSKCSLCNQHPGLFIHVPRGKRFLGEAAIWGRVAAATVTSQLPLWEGNSDTNWEWHCPRHISPCRLDLLLQREQAELQFCFHFHSWLKEREGKKLKQIIKCAF